MKSPLAARHRIVLLGVGHTHAHIVRMWGMGQQIPDTELICVSNFGYATYSGMLPAVVAGDVPPAAMQIDLVRLCQKSGARLIIGDVEGIDRDRRELRIEGRPPLPYDALSIGIGSVPHFGDCEIATSANVVTIKPMQTFLSRLTNAISNLPAERRELRVAIIGGGVASFEIAFCLEARLREGLSANRTAEPLDKALSRFQNGQFQVHSASPSLDGGLYRSTAARLSRALQQSDIRFFGNHRVVSLSGTTLQFENGDSSEADVVIWATGAVAPPLLSQLDLQRDERGFLLTKDTLQTISDPNIFAVGDSGTLAEAPTPKAGVYAVRQGPFLLKNLERLLSRKPLVRYLPQRGFLKLINLGHRQALGEYRGLSFQGHFAWRLKQRIDVGFMEKYQDYRIAPMSPAATIKGDQTSDDSTVMRCLGCGGKVAGNILAEILQEVLPEPAPGTTATPPHRPVDDAAVLTLASPLVTVSTDHFSAPFDDPFLFGKTIALHAASDLFAMGASPTHAVAHIEIPFGNPRGQARTLRELMAGIVSELTRMNIRLVGGHTIEGPRLTAGVTLLGQQRVTPTRKSQVNVGDELILTQALGTGLYLAAHMQAKLSAEGYLELIESLGRGNGIGPEVAERFQIQAMTDITGFGLAGHLREMLEPSNSQAEIWLSEIPLLAQVEKLLGDRIESTLAPSNQQSALDFGLGGKLTHPRTRALFDPQTCGGLLLACPRERTAETLAFIRERGCPQASVVGQILPPRESVAKITLVEHHRRES